MTEQETMPTDIVTETTPDNETSSGTKLPSTPDRSHRSSSSSSSNQNAQTKKEEPIIPSTPPQGSRRKFSIGAFQSPGDLATNSNDLLPPATPMSNSGKFKLSNVPQTPFSAKSSNELTTSPLKSPSTFQDNEDLEKPPIRQISSTLKARLSYAFVKYQHGWTNQSLDELEKTVGNKDPDLVEPFKELAAAQKASQSKTYDDFWNNGNTSSSSSKKSLISPSKVTKPTNSLLKSPTKVNLERDVDQIEDDGSANLAFLQAISKTRSPKRRSHLQTNLRIDASKYTNPQQNPEAEAIESLMSLSSPQSFKPKPDFTNQQNLPRQRLSFGENLSRGSTTNNSPQRYQSNDNAIETESDTEYEHSNSTDEEDVSTQSQSNEIKAENDEDMEVRTTSTISTKSGE